MRAKRRLAAVMCADVAHYSRLMEVDEDGTLDRLKSYREIMSQLAERHSGRIVNTWGDAVIIEFSSVVEAVQCAVDIQTELSLRNADLPDARKMEFRIGLNLGDLMVEGDDIYGDGVNVAARLQELAPRGGILLSQSVYDQVHSKLALGFEPQGPQHVKNVSEPVATYAVRLGGRNAPAVREDPRDQASDARSMHVGGPVGDRDAAALANGFEQARAWLRRQPRMVRRSVFMIGFFFVLNLLTTGLSPLWFVWPSLPFFAAMMWHLFLGKGDRKFRDGSHQAD
jgi:adenylate cyclase